MLLFKRSFLLILSKWEGIVDFPSKYVCRIAELTTFFDVSTPKIRKLLLKRNHNWKYSNFSYKNLYLFHPWSNKCVKGTVVNLTCNSINGGSLLSLVPLNVIVVGLSSEILNKLSLVKSSEVPPMRVGKRRFQLIWSDLI